MARLSQTVTWALRCTPRPIKDGVRWLTPQWIFQMVARAAAGDSLFAEQDAGSHLYDRRVRQLEHRLWHGFAGVAVGDLDAFMRGKASKRARAEAALVLARYHLAAGDAQRALAGLSMLHKNNRRLWTSKPARMIEAWALFATGQFAKAQAVARQAASANPEDADLRMADVSMAMASAKCGGDDATVATDSYLEGLNYLLEQAGFVGLAAKDPRQPLSLNNLMSRKAMQAPARMPVKVSVLMAVYNGEQHLACAVRSVLAQTWRNLELVIVDDVSTDGSWDLIQQLAAEDERVVPIRQPVNGGAYVARNTGLQRATGEYVTVNDADDWAHPQKIQRQVEALLAPGAQLANVSALMRVDGDMRVQPRFDNPRVPIIHRNFSSLMLPRKLALDMGGWDRVRISGDSEFIGRLQAIHGASAVAELLAQVPLSLALLEKSNLTASSSRSLWTFRFGARREYARQFKEWHHSSQSRLMHRTSRTAPFPIPGLCAVEGEVEHIFDTVLVSDFQHVRDLQEHLQAGHAVAILPWPDYDEDCDKAMPEDVSRLCREHGIVTLVHGEEVHCRRLLILRPHLLLHVLDKIPVIHADTVSMITRVGDTDRHRLDANIKHLFGQSAHCVEE